MQLEHENREELEKMILAAIGKHLDLSQYDVFFFGSRISGKGDADSDIDVGIEGTQPVPPGILGKIREEIEELPILYRMDVIDFKAAGEVFQRVAKSHIQMIHPKAA